MNRAYLRLVAAIILRAIMDISAGPGKCGGEQVRNYRSALRFLKSSWFEKLAVAVGIDPENARRVFLDKEKHLQVIEASRNKKLRLEQAL